MTKLLLVLRWIHLKRFHPSSCCWRLSSTCACGWTIWISFSCYEPSSESFYSIVQTIAMQLDTFQVDLISLFKLSIRFSCYARTCNMLCHVVSSGGGFVCRQWDYGTFAMRERYEFVDISTIYHACVVLVWGCSFMPPFFHWARQKEVKDVN